MKSTRLRMFLFISSTAWCACQAPEGHDHAKMQEQEKMNNTVDTSLEVVVRSPAQTIISSQSVVKPLLSYSSYAHNAQGYIALDPTRNENIAARFNGRIEKLYLRYDFQYVKKGEKIMEIYSPELNTAEEEYLFIYNSGKDTALMHIARQKLLLLGMTNAQITQLEQTRKTSETIAIYSPFEGYARIGIPKQSSSVDLAPNGNNGAMQMNVSANKQVGSQSTGEIREGSYISKGQTLFTINDYKKVWVVLASDVATYPIGTPLKLTSEQWKDSVINTAINFAEPVFAGGQKFTTYRVYLDNQDHSLLLNSLVTAAVSSDNTQHLELPESSVLSLGKRKIVWIKTGVTSGGANIFEAHDVTTGVVADGHTEITSGLTIDDEVAVKAGFMIDSQSIIQPE